MAEIINFVKEILMLESKERMPIGLCGFDCVQETTTVKKKPRRKREMRLSELMDK